MSACPIHFHPLCACPDCRAVSTISCIEHDLRVASLELWVVGWTPDELIDHVRRSVADPRAADLMAWAIVVDDSLRSDQSRPVEWCRAVHALRARLDVDLHDLGPGWIARWIRANSTLDTSPAVARLLRDVCATLDDLLAPSPAPG